MTTEWDFYRVHFGPKKTKRHAFYMGVVAALAFGDDRLHDLAQEIDEYLQEHGCLCEACQASLVNGKVRMAQDLLASRFATE
jgi:hypothetical protein